MTEHSELLPNLLDEDAFEMQMRGYSRRQVDEYVAGKGSEIRDLQERLARALDESEQLRQQLAAIRQQAGTRPPHEEVSERIAQILKLADDEAKAQKARASEDIANIRHEAKREADAALGEAREKADRTLTSAQDQAESFVSAARAEADRARETARAEAEQAGADAHKEADELLVSARSKAERMLAESTARSTAINDGAARRLELLSGTHVEAARRLAEIRDVVTELLSRDSARGSLEDEVAKAVAGAMSGTAESPRVPGQSPPADARMARKTTKPAAQTPAAASVGTTAPAQPVVSPSIAPQPAGPSGPHARPAPGAAPTAPPSPAPQPVRSGGQRQAGPAERQAGTPERQAGPAERQAGPAERQAGTPERQADTPERQASAAERPLGLGRDHSARDQAARGTAGDDSAQHQARKVTGPN